MAETMAPSLAEDMAAKLRERLARGDMQPGQKLSEAALAADLGISRNTLREVFRLLSREGILRHEPNRGVFVETPSMASTHDIFRIRRMIEVPALAQAWHRHPAVTVMRKAVETADQCRSTGDWRGVGSANMAFHSAIVALSDSPRLAAFFAQIIVELRLAFGLLDNPEMLHAPYITRNQEILERLEAGDAKGASELLETYLRQSESDVMAAFARIER